MKFHFSKEYGVELDPTDGRLILTLVESEGFDLDDLLCNARISLETWHGNEGPDWNLGDLPNDLYSMVEQDMAIAIADALSHAAENRADVAWINGGSK